jgi:hypothetical protein
MRKLFRLSSVLATAALAACASGPNTGNSEALATPASLEKKGISPASPRTLLMAYVSTRIQANQLDNAQFLEISRRCFPSIQREVEAIRISGIKEDLAQTEKTLTKFRGEFGKLPGSVYQLYAVSFGASARPSPLWGMSTVPGTNAVYSAARGGIVTDILFDMPRAANDTPVPPNFVRAKDFISGVEVAQRRGTVLVPMSEDAYRQAVYKATQAGRTYVPEYSVLIVYKPAACTLGANSLSCSSDILSSQVFAPAQYQSNGVIRGAVVSFN